MAAARVARPCTDASTASPSSASAVISSPSRRTSVADGSLTLTELPSTQVSPEDVYTLERLAGVHDPGQERLEFLG